MPTRPSENTILAVSAPANLPLLLNCRRRRVSSSGSYNRKRAQDSVNVREASESSTASSFSNENKSGVALLNPLRAHVVAMEAGSISKAFMRTTPSPVAWSSRRPTWEAIGRTSLSCKLDTCAASLWTGFDRRVSRLRIRSNGRTEAGHALGATLTLHNVLAYLKKLDFDNEFRSSQNHFSAKYDHFTVHEARLEQEFKGAAWLRAETYSEQQAYTRYVDSFTKKFAEQEFTALKRRVSDQNSSYVCLVAVSKDLPEDAVDLACQDGENGSRVLGSLDVSLHHPSPGEAFGGQGLPYGYIANVCVDKSARKQGIASALMECAVRVGRDWGLNAIYVHTHATNQAAFKLYVKKGFEVLDAGCPQKLVDGNLLLRLQL